MPALLTVLLFVLGAAIFSAFVSAIVPGTVVPCLTRESYCLSAEHLGTLATLSLRIAVLVGAFILVRKTITRTRKRPANVAFAEGAPSAAPGGASGPLACKRPPHFPNPLPREGVHVHLRATFGGIEGIPWVAFAWNTFNPLLVLYEDEVEVRLFRKRRRPYRAIVAADARHLLKRTNNIVLLWDDAVLPLAANVISLPVGDRRRYEALCDIVQFLGSKGVPLTSGAQRLLAPGRNVPD